MRRIQGAEIGGLTLLILIAISYQNCGKGLLANRKISNTETVFSQGDQIFVGDMVLDRSDINMGGLSIRAATSYKRYDSQSWKNGLVPVEFDSSFPVEHRPAFWAACQEWKAAAGVSCQPRQRESNYLLVKAQTTASNKTSLPGHKWELGEAVVDEKPTILAVRILFREKSCCMNWGMSLASSMSSKGAIVTSTSLSFGT